ncbi:MAG TPA: enolase C-terminal domain-like protein [Nitrolancea sp.]|nr:enolase C-terminal domain-like protein [Nitrolancea sp.]
MLANEKMGQLHSMAADDDASLVCQFFPAPYGTPRALVIHHHGIQSHGALTVIIRMRRYAISAVERAVPVDDLEGLRQATVDTSETIIVDESLRTVEETAVLAEERARDAFNIRESKCGGVTKSILIAHVADQTGLAPIVGAQGGESWILSAAGTLSPASARRLHRGFRRLTVENVLPGWKGRARPYSRGDPGVRIKETTRRKYGRVYAISQASPTKVEKVR